MQKLEMDEVASNSSYVSSSPPASSGSAELRMPGTVTDKNHQHIGDSGGPRGVFMPPLKMSGKAVPNEERGDPPLTARGRGGPAAEDDYEEDYSELSPEEHSSDGDNMVDARQGSGDLWEDTMAAVTAHRAREAAGVSGVGAFDGDASRGRREASQGASHSAAARHPEDESVRVSAAIGNASPAAGSSSAPAATFLENKSEGSEFSDQAAAAAYERHRRDQCGGGEGEMEEYSMKEAGNSWHETLSRFPALLQLYPLADSSEWEGPPDGEGDDAAKEVEPSSQAGNSEPAHDVHGSEVAAAAVAAAAAYVQTESRNAAREAADRPAEPSTHPEGGAQVEVLPTRRHAPDCQHAEPSIYERYQDATSWENWPESNAAAGTPHVRQGTTPPPHTPARGAHGRPQATPHSVSSWAGPYRARSAGRSGGTFVPERCWTSVDVATAWAEVDQARYDVELRERELLQREAAVRRGEARNAAAARQLADLRHRLDDYSMELEQGVMALTAQQQALREERRQTMEMQARVRRMCAAAVRDDVVASKARDWDRMWTPARKMTGP